MARLAPPSRGVAAKWMLLGLCLLLCGAAAPAPARPRPGSAALSPRKPRAPLRATRTLKIPYSRYQLGNGLTVILHEDRAQPLVAVNIGVGVGSADESAGRTGFAHLFEHLMFMGTARVPEKMFDEWMELAGAANNAWTSTDRTGYHELGPSHSLPLLLWLEADRLAVLGAQMAQPKLDLQRGVVRNERRQTSENEPYGKAELRLPELLFPVGHPYHHPVIGSHADLEAASLGDVQAFFAKWYVPANMALVVAGDFDQAAIRPQLARYFGAIPAGAGKPQSQPVPAPVRLGAVVRESLEDNVTLPKTTMAWHSPARFEPGDAELDLLAEIATNGKASRLYKPLVHERQLAQGVSAGQRSMALGSYFAVEALSRPGVSLDDLEAAIDAELSVLRDAPVGEEELVRAKNQYETSFVSRMQSLGHRAAMLGDYQLSRGEPDWAAQDLDRYRRVTRESLHEVARRVLDPGSRVILRVVPAAAPAAAPEGGP
ncbi:MAG: insulinase family protein [Deltaproteobacteria bacterium]|nr:insulinase family protein [Deltaproteobacteria bacterium]